MDGVSGMLEKDIVKAIRKELESRGAFTMKTHGSPMSAGYPDILVCYRGRFVAIEVKRPTTRHTVTARQQAFLDAIAAAGGAVGVAVSVDEALAILPSQEADQAQPH